MTTNFPRKLAILAIALLVAGSAIAVAAPGPGPRGQMDDDDRRGHRADDNRTDDHRGRDAGKAGDHRGPGPREGREHPRLAFRQHCLDGNATVDGNSTVDGNATADGNMTADGNATEERCKKIREAHEPGAKARRLEHALEAAIAAHERRLARLENLSAELQSQIDGNGTADGNATGNETDDGLNATELQHRLDIVLMHIAKTELRLAHLEAIQARLELRWAEVREWREEHPRHQRHGDDDEADEDADESEDDDLGADDGDAGDDSTDDSADGDSADDDAGGDDSVDEPVDDSEDDDEDTEDEPQGNVTA